MYPGADDGSLTARWVPWNRSTPQRGAVGIWNLFVVLGALMSLDSLISLADSALFLLSVFNIIGLYLLAPVVKRELASFLEFVRARKAGEISDGDEDQESVKTTV